MMKRLKNLHYNKKIYNKNKNKNYCLLKDFNKNKNKISGLKNNLNKSRD